MAVLETRSLANVRIYDNALFVVAPPNVRFPPFATERRFRPIAAIRRTVVASIQVLLSGRSFKAQQYHGADLPKPMAKPSQNYRALVPGYYVKHSISEATRFRATPCTSHRLMAAVQTAAYDARGMIGAPIWTAHSLAVLYTRLTTLYLSVVRADVRPLMISEETVLCRRLSHCFTRPMLHHRQTTFLPMVLQNNGARRRAWFAENGFVISADWSQAAACLRLKLRGADERRQPSA